MKTLYDLKKEERNKYKQDYKNTIVGKEQMNEAYRFFIATIISFIIGNSISFIETKNIVLITVENFVNIFCTVSFVITIITLVIHEIDFKIWLTLKLQSKKK